MSELKFLAHIPYAFQPGEAVDEIRGTASRNELLFLSFSLLADDDLDVTLELTSLEGPKGAQLAGDLHVVHKWTQSGLGVYQSAATDVDELLLKSDSVLFRDAYRRRCDTWWHIHRSRSRYVAPDVRLSGNVRASLIAKKPRQFWISINVDSECRPGEYRGCVNVIRKGRPDVQATVRVDVLPVTLAEPDQDVMIWYRGTLNCHHPHHYVSRKNFATQLNDIRRHGFRSISLWETDRGGMQEAIDIAHDAGFSGNLILDAYRESVWSGVDFRGLTPIVYVADEPDARSPAEMQRAVRMSESLRAKNVKTMASVIHCSSIDEIDANVVCVYAPSNLTEVMNAASSSSSQQRIYYYWQAHMEKPIVHRLLSGAFLWKSGAAGISPYCYQHLPGFPFSPFDDFDSWDPKEQAPHGKTFRDHFATYPARGGVIRTMQWSGMADGITDLRYLATRGELLKKAEASGDKAVAEKARRIRERGVELIDSIRPETLEILSDSNPLPADYLSAEFFQEMRAALIRDVVALSPESLPSASG